MKTRNPNFELFENVHSCMKKPLRVIVETGCDPVGRNIEKPYNEPVKNAGFRKLTCSCGYCLSVFVWNSLHSKCVSLKY